LWRLWANFYIRNLILAVSVVVLGMLSVHVCLTTYTRHGQAFELPDFTGLLLPEAQLCADEMYLRLEIVDSVYIAGRQRGIVIEQNPKPKAKVKRNRRVFLTMNAVNAKKVAAPYVVGLSLRQAKVTIEQVGLEVGELSFVSDIASGNVIDQLYRGQRLPAGEQLVLGSKIGLLLGRSYGKEATPLPSLKGLSLPLAKNRIIEASLNVGAVKYDQSVQTLADSLEAKVYAQHPTFDESVELEVGTPVDIYLSLPGKE
jgi:beta-lactam-binding protein with PASTA domain